MDWTQFAVMLGTFTGLFFWNRTESRSDQRQMLSIVQQIQKDSKDFQLIMAQESKDFHGRLCAIEERNRK